MFSEVISEQQKVSECTELQWNNLNLHKIYLSRQKLCEFTKCITKDVRIDDHNIQCKHCIVERKSGALFRKYGHE